MVQNNGTLLSKIPFVVFITLGVHFFQDKQDLMDQPVFRKAILNHLPAFIRENTKYRARVKNLSPKFKSAILASQIGSSIVYHGGWEVYCENRLKDYLKKQNGKVGKGPRETH